MPALVRGGGRGGMGATGGLHGGRDGEDCAIRVATGARIEPGFGARKGSKKGSLWAKGAGILASLRGICAKYSVLLALLLLWELSGRLGWADQAFLPSLSATMATLVGMWGKAHLFMH
ncbi:MAG: hypothetical protein LBF40_05760, partial [Deltaproteobacteria bacterium]|nr:hypothetical protein [Deltaproteobacteria bacterium]